MGSWSEKAIPLSASNPIEELSRPIPIDGILNIDKPADWTSHDVVARVRRLLQQKRVGHAGTLDPLAIGVLPICLGQATRMVEYLSANGKAYRATIVFGVETTTYDAEGEIVAASDLPPTLDRDAIAAVLPEFLGEIQQVPPIYSALKRQGKPLYALARAGVILELEPRPVRIDVLDIVSWEAPMLVLDIVCGKGTYIRSLAHDLGQRLGSGAHMAGLIRTRVGSFCREDALPLDDLAAAVADGTWKEHLFAADEALLHWSAAILAPTSEQRLRTGQRLHFAASTTAAATEAPQRLLRAYSVDGRFLGILGEREVEEWQPEKVLAITPDDG